MNETIKFWLENMYKSEINDAEGTIENEEIFKAGSTGKAVDMHQGNIDLLNDYIRILKELMKNLK